MARRPAAPTAQMNQGKLNGEDSDRLSIDLKSVLIEVSFSRAFKSISNVLSFLSNKAAPFNMSAGNESGSSDHGTLSGGGEIWILKCEVIVWEFRLIEQDSGMVILYTFEM